LIQAAQSVRVLGTGSLAHCEKSMTEATIAAGMTAGVKVGQGVGCLPGSSVTLGAGGWVAATGTGSGGTVGSWVAAGLRLPAI
jgi:hypothetical protein